MSSSCQAACITCSGRALAVVLLVHARDCVPDPVRMATDDDLVILRALVSPTRVPDSGFTYVVPYGGGLAAVAHLEVEGTEGQLELLVIAEDEYTPDVERRVIGVAGVLAVGHGCRTL